MELFVKIDKSLYDKVNRVAANNKKEQMMLFGCNIVDDKLIIDSDSIKWFTSDELVYQDDETVEIDEGLLVDKIMELNNKKYNSVIMLHSHPCDTIFDDFLYGSLSEADIVNSKKLLLICRFMNIRYFDGVSTGKHIYFWSIDNDKMLPVQMSCYVDNDLVDSRVPGTIQELVDLLRKNNKK